MPPPYEDPRRRLLERHNDNPLLTAHDWPYFVNTVFNCGVAQLPSGETLLLVRVEDCSGLSHLCAARSKDGVTDWKIDPEPTFNPDPKNHLEEFWGIEDPRIVWVDELDMFAITYTCFSQRGPGVSLALTKDFITFDRKGILFPPEDKDAALLPKRIDGRWAVIHRPVPGHQRAHIWISYSPDLRHWGDHKIILSARHGAWWDANKIGLSPPLVETPEGWLMLYHGVRMTPAGCIYRMGLALMDLEDPSRCIRRCTKWIMGPEAEYERTGDVGGVIFPCGYTIRDDGDTMYLYYGAADTSIALATGSVRKMLAWLKENSTSCEPAVDEPAS